VSRRGFWRIRLPAPLFQPQFEVISHDGDPVPELNSLGTIGRLDAGNLRLLQRRINTMDPGNGIHASSPGGEERSGRSLQIQAYLVNFESKVGEMELEKNLIDMVPLRGDPLPTEQRCRKARKFSSGGTQTFPRDGSWSWPTPRFPLIDSEY